MTWHGIRGMAYDTDGAYCVARSWLSNIAMPMALPLALAAASVSTGGGGGGAVSPTCDSSRRLGFGTLARDARPAQQGQLPSTSVLGGGGGLGGLDQI